MLLNMKYVFWFSPQLLSEIFLILRRIEQHIKNIYWSSCKALIFLVRKKKKCKASLLYQPLRSNSKRQHNSWKLIPAQLVILWHLKVYCLLSKRNYKYTIFLGDDTALMGNWIPTFRGHFDPWRWWLYLASKGRDPTTH